MTYDFISKKFRVLVFQSQTVILRILAPLFQIDNQIDVLIQLYTFYTKQ